MLALPSDVAVDWPDSADATLHAEVHRLLRDVVELGGAVGWTHVPTPDETAEWLDRELGLVRARAAALAVVRRSGRVEAVGLWARFRSPVLRHNAEVRKVMVHPAARGFGLGRVVLQSLAERAAQSEVEVLVLDVRGNNHGAQALYASLGWLECGRVPDFIAVGDDRWDQVSFYLELPRPDGVRRHGGRPVGPGASSR
ncbi:MAG TPA: GNAT family N-acetyltransferase [Mycobacteriales bacterium]|nr:GNAT family N-acetyltransferase [Mycobacteriales bacterium]